jgi:hypothetical protein
VSHDEVRKLLGGYATNTLTETERKALFDAALEDQELFDALHQEQALKDLLTDPVSCDQIRRALEKPAVPVAWWSRWWTWTGAASAVAAAVLTVAIIRSHTPESQPAYASLDRAKPASIPPNEKLESDEKATPQLLKRLVSPRLAGRQASSASGALSTKRTTEAREERKDQQAFPTTPAANPAAPSPPTAPTEQVQVQSQASPPVAVPRQSRATDTQAQSQMSAGQVANSLRDQKQDQVRNAQVIGGVSGGLFKSTPVSYSVLKRDDSGAYQPLPPAAQLQTGDAVRLTVAPIISGYLSLSRQDASGQWMRVFPETGPGLPVSANANYTIPDSPIAVTDADQRLRLTLVPALNTDAFSAGRLKAKSAPLKKESTMNAPLVVDITIGPKKAP